MLSEWREWTCACTWGWPLLCDGSPPTRGTGIVIEAGGIEGCACAGARAVAGGPYISGGGDDVGGADAGAGAGGRPREAVDEA